MLHGSDSNSDTETKGLSPIRECATPRSTGSSVHLSDSNASLTNLNNNSQSNQLNMASFNRQQSELLNHSIGQLNKPGNRISLPPIVVPKSNGYENPAYVPDDNVLIIEDLYKPELDCRSNSFDNKLDNMFTFEENTVEENLLAMKENEKVQNRKSKKLKKYKTGKKILTRMSSETLKRPDWDKFETLPPPDEDETHKSEFVEVSIRWFKIFAYFFTFVVVMTFSIFSKTLILLMVSMISVDNSVTVCNNNEDQFIIHPPLDHDKQYIAVYNTDSVQRITWLWCLYFATIAPYMFTLGRSLRICYFKYIHVPKWETFLTVFVMESLHCIGLSLLLFVILPKVDSTRGAMMMNSVATVPAIIRLLVDNETDDIRKNEEPMPKLTSMILSPRKLSWFNFSIQMTVIIGWTILEYSDNLVHWYMLPISLILVSFEWWENYLIPKFMMKKFEFLDRARKDLIKSRYTVYTIMSVWKIAVILMVMLLNEYTNGETVTKMMFQNFTSGFDAREISIIRDKRNFESHMLLDNEKHQLYAEDTLIPLWILIAHISITYTCYAFAKFTCKVCFQGISFAIPLCITVPMTVSTLWALSNISLQDKCKLVSVFAPFQYIFWNVDKLDNVVLNSSWINVLVIIIWFISLFNQIANTLQIWQMSTERLASTEQLFVNPMYNAALIDQSLVFNRRWYKLDLISEEDDGEQSKPKEQKESQEQTGSFLKPDINNNVDLADPNGAQPNASPISSDNETEVETELDDDSWKQDWHKVCKMLGIEEDSIDVKPNPEEDETIRIYICATMWHEDRNEMLQMLKAVMRLDYEQGARRIASKKFGKEQQKLIYEMEVNIFFDDAYEQGDTDDRDDRVINRFVHQLIDTINEAAEQVMVNKVHIEDPTIVPTPYGGKLIWQMPMKNRLIAHIKDKDLIRHRKRWSQCMYMYYLLGYRLAARKDISYRRRRKIMNNTFVLALDGDINFRPEAVDMVVDLMLKNAKLGAACGRIHPIGSGPIVWYQKFEYAIGHWLQKATEHVFGCVLCSPGCFSLFRASAVMADSVMNKYTTKPTEALHYVQYDQGEDRWLCTLMLQQGWRIEYCAASDSYTHAPEGFAEFYTQRRRWAPSTMANILDLLGDYKQTVKVNENISYLYILYQAMMMLGTVISPGTIFLMVVSAMNTVMGFDSQTSLLCNLIPILAFTFVSLTFKDNNIKINFAMILSVIYALLMLAVLVGTGIDMYRQGFLSPNSLFFTAMMSSFVVAAILHPQEFACVIPLPIYMLFIPSMYLLLTIYSITNMHIVAWGTREVKSKLSAKEMQKLKEEEEAKAKALKAKKSNFSFMDMSQYGNKNGLFTCMCCTSSPRDDAVTLQDIHLQVKNMNQVITSINSDVIKQINKTPESSNTEEQVSKTEETESKTEDKTSDDRVKPSAPEEIFFQKSNNQNKPRWVMTDPKLRSFPFKPIHELESEFWDAMIKKYLYPLDENLKEKERIQNELEDLRNKSVFAFGFMNVIFILFVFMLQLHKDVFGVDIPVEITYNKTFDPETKSYSFEQIRKVTRMDPINFVLVIFFGLILIVQLIGMFIHRFGTLAHLLAYTEINEKKREFDASAFVRSVLENKRSKQKQSTSDIDNEDSESDKFKPVEYTEVFDQEMQKLETDQVHLEKLPKLLRKKTKRAINKSRNVSFNRRGTITSEASLDQTNSSPRNLRRQLSNDTSTNTFDSRRVSICGDSNIQLRQKPFKPFSTGIKRPETSYMSDTVFNFPNANNTETSKL